MHCLLTPIGSAGDNLPLIGIGHRLRQRGHAVTVLANDHFGATVRYAGLEFTSVGTEEEYRRSTEDPEIWHPTRGYQTVMKLVCLQLERIFEQVQSRIRGDTLLVTPTLDFASRAIAEKHGLPAAAVHLQPIILRTMYETPVGFGTLDFNFMPRWLKRCLYAVCDRWMLDPPLLACVNGLRGKLGLAPIRRLLRDHIHPKLSIGLFPDWFAPVQPDWPKQVRLTGFPLYEALDGATMGEDVEAFVARGDKPVVITPGSAMLHGQDFFAQAARACVTLGLRAILLTRETRHLPPNLPQTIAHFPFVPLTRLLPKCAALVHQGGIGTTAAGLAGGVPQLIMPMSHDQPDNAARIVKLGAGERLMPKQFTAGNVETKLRAMVESKQMKQRCADLSERMARSDGLGMTCDLIEGVGQT